MLDALKILAAAIVATFGRPLPGTVGRTRRQIARCPRCKAAHSRTVLALRYDRGGKLGPARTHTLDGQRTEYAPTWRCTCSREYHYSDISGRYNAAIKCTARCVAATGHDCECSCSGKNHGASHGA